MKEGRVKDHGEQATKASTRKESEGRTKGGPSIIHTHCNVVVATILVRVEAYIDI